MASEVLPIPDEMFADSASPAPPQAPARVWLLGIDPGPCNQGHAYGVFDLEKKTLYLDAERTTTVHFLPRVQHFDNRMQTLQAIQHELAAHFDFSRLHNAYVVAEKQYTGKAAYLVEWEGWFSGFLQGRYEPQVIGFLPASTVSKVLGFHRKNKKKESRDLVAQLVPDLFTKGNPEQRTQHVVDAVCVLIAQIGQMAWYTPEKGWTGLQVKWGVPAELLD